MECVHAYIDESGNHDIETGKIGATDYFIVVAVLIKECEQDAILREVEKIRIKYFQTGEIKSSSLKDKDNHQRRIRILEEILKLDFKFYALAVNKSAVVKDSGLRFKKSFIKFVNGLLYSQLFRSFSEIRITADAHGDQEFIDSFKSYIDANHKPDLFWQSHFDVIKSEQNVLVQMADFIVGSIAKIYEGKSNPALNEAYYRLIKEKALHIHEWPTKYQTYYPPIQESEEYDSFIYKHALAQAEVFLDSNLDSCDEEVRLQCSVLSHLVFISRFDQQRGYVATQEILSHLLEVGFQNVTEQAIRSRIVAKLRDQGVLISSCNQGYKIPKGYKDLVDFVERVNGLVIPLLDRLRKARSSFMIASQGKVDLLRGPNFPDLTAFIDHLEK
ncbi:DUF3800 domain-containing protein [Oxalobacteraceae bacterium R-40]|uniref:DUF3800 domain-containing protein n=1 Tax=Keguizhuia sedimenti TaxID=3064264 RepID=A0ABU1BIK9_9BURK|nr:DUF3800 domain-containing protein [Oxalobacteraceae bacterium R-40]